MLALKVVNRGVHYLAYHAARQSNVVRGSSHVILFFALHFTLVVRYGRSKKKKIFNYLTASPFLCAIEIILQECADFSEFKESSTGNNVQKLQWLRYGTLESLIFSGARVQSTVNLYAGAHAKPVLALAYCCAGSCNASQKKKKKKKKNQRKGGSHALTIFRILAFPGPFSLANTYSRVPKCAVFHPFSWALLLALRSVQKDFCWW